MIVTCTHTAEEVFSSISEVPLGAASLAQCHMGQLRDGRVVAIKIQHPDVRKNAYSDMATITVSTSSTLSRIAISSSDSSFKRPKLYVQVYIPSCPALYCEPNLM